MNRRMGAIVKKSFKERYLGYIPGRVVPGMNKNYIVRLITYLLSYGMITYFYFIMARGYGEIYLNMTEEPSLYFAMFGVLVSISIILFQMNQIMREFFSVRDNYIMLTYPIKSNEILMGNFFGDIFSDVDHLLFLAALLVVYSRHMRLTPSIVLLSILNFPMLVIIPKAIITILILLLIKVTNFGKLDNFFRIFRYIVSFVLIGAFYYFAFSNQDGITMENFTQSEIITSSADRLSAFFYYTRIYGDSITGKLPQNLLNTLILWAIGIGLVVVLNYLAKLYYRDTLMVKDAPSTKSRKSKTREASFNNKSPVRAIAKHELQSITSDIAYLSPMIITTIMYFVIFFGANRDIMQTGSEYFSKTEPEVLFFSFIIGLASGAFIWIYSQATKGSLSREGSKFYLFQTLPLPAKDHLNGRILGIFYLSVIYNMVVCLVFMFFYKTSPLGTLIMFVGSMIGALVANMVAIYQGTFNINIHWTKPTEVNQRQGARALVDMIVALVIAGAIVGLAFLVYSKFNETITVLIILVLMAITFIIFYNLALKRYKKGFKDL